MTKLFVLFLVFVAVMVPVAFFTFSDENKNGSISRKNKDSKRSETDVLPSVYVLSKIPVAVLEMAGVGELCNKCFPSDRLKLAEALLFANLKLRTATVYCAQLSLFVPRRIFRAVCRRRGQSRKRNDYSAGGGIRGLRRMRASAYGDCKPRPDKACADARRNSVFNRLDNVGIEGRIGLLRGN